LVLSDQANVPLHAASANGDVLAMEALLKAGANVNQVDK
jgi:ankyrin repeat protein